LIKIELQYKNRKIIEKFYPPPPLNPPPPGEMGVHTMLGFYRPIYFLYIMASF